MCEPRRFGKRRLLVMIYLRCCCFGDGPLDAIFILVQQGWPDPSSLVMCSVSVVKRNLVVDLSNV